MTTVDEARAALLAGIVDDESGMETFDDALIDALIAAVRAETLHNLGPFGPEQRYLDGLAQGRHESAETLRPLDVPSVNELRHALQMALPAYQWSDVHLERVCADLRRAARARLTRREPLDVERLARAYIHVRHAHNPTPDELEADQEVRPCAWCRLAAEQHVEADAEYTRLEAADKP